MAMEDELLGNLKKKPVTLKFPYERAEPCERIRAKVSWEIEKCIGCMLCEKICPSSAITVIGKGREAEIEYNVGRCIFCGECVDICPTKTIHTTKEFEIAFTNTTQMITYFKRKKSEQESRNNQ
jgi:formate hydrogenlyase subunit 6/NADH:ubiquinone oxidoreductase subunit I